MIGTSMFIGGLGPLEIGIIVLLIVVLFGSKRIPELARSLGRAQKEYEKSKKKAQEEVKEYEKELEKKEGNEDKSEDIVDEDAVQM